MEALPEDVLLNIFERVAETSCIGIAAVSASSPALRRIVNAHKSLLYRCSNVYPLMQLVKWSDAHSEFMENALAKAMLRHNSGLAL